MIFIGPACKCAPPLPTDDGEVVVAFAFHCRAATPWSAAGSVVADDEFVLPRTVTRHTTRPHTPAAPAPRTGYGQAAAPVDVRSQSDDHITVGAGGSEFTFRLDDATVSRWQVAGRDILSGPLHLNLTRALTDNDRGYGNFDPRLSVVQREGMWSTGRVEVKRTHTELSSAGWTLSLLVTHPGLKLATCQYQVTPDGDLAIRHQVVPRRNMIRFGVGMELPDARSVRWYGKGPHENYIDRNHGSATRLHEAATRDLEHRYMRPQENGNHTEVRWLEVLGTWGRLQVQDLSGAHLGFTAWHYSQEHLDAAEHLDELQYTEALTLNVDERQRGVGGDIPGLAALHEPYKLLAGVKRTLHARFSASPDEIQGA